MSSVVANEESKCYELNCGVLITDGLIDISGLKSYLESRIKVKGKVNCIEGNVDLMCTTESIIITPKVKLSKKYLKYLCNKYLYKMELKDWVRIISSGKKSYKLIYYKTAAAENQE